MHRRNRTDAPETVRSYEITRDQFCVQIVAANGFNPFSPRSGKRSMTNVCAERITVFEIVYTCCRVVSYSDLSASSSCMSLLSVVFRESFRTMFFDRIEEHGKRCVQEDMAPRQE